MVALPTPARAATASIESASAVVPSASRSMTAAMIASSARTLRGRPGPLRSGSAGAMSVVLTVNIVTPTRQLGQRRRWSGRVGPGPAGDLVEHLRRWADDESRQVVPQLRAAVELLNLRLLPDLCRDRRRGRQHRRATWHPGQRDDQRYH